MNESSRVVKPELSLDLAVDDVARGSSCSVYSVRSLEGRGKRCIKRYEKPVSKAFLKLLERLRAPRGLNVPVVFHWSLSGHEGDVLLVEEEWIEGFTLRQIMRESPEKAVLNALKWSAQLAITLSRLHDFYGFVHHDLKPENIIIDQFEDAVLIDFDSVRAIGSKTSAFHSEASHEPGEGRMIKGTKGYAPPEACLFSGSCEAAADLYSFGKLFLEITALQPHSFSPGFYDILRRCARIDARYRIESASALSEALRNLVGES